MTTTPNEPVQDPDQTPGEEPTEVPAGDPGVGGDDDRTEAPRVDADEGDPHLDSYPG